MERLWGPTEVTAYLFPGLNQSCSVFQFGNLGFPKAFIWKRILWLKTADWGCSQETTATQKRGGTDSFPDVSASVNRGHQQPGHRLAEDDVSQRSAWHVGAGQ